MGKKAHRKQNHNTNESDSSFLDVSTLGDAGLGLESLHTPEQRARPVSEELYMEPEPEPVCEAEVCVEETSDQGEAIVEELAEEISTEMSVDEEIPKRARWAAKKAKSAEEKLSKITEDSLLLLFATLSIFSTKSLSDQRKNNDDEMVSLKTTIEQEFISHIEERTRDILNQSYLASYRNHDTRRDLIDDLPKMGQKYAEKFQARVVRGECVRTLQKSRDRIDEAVKSLQDEDFVDGWQIWPGRFTRTGQRDNDRSASLVEHLSKFQHHLAGTENVVKKLIDLHTP